MLYVRNEVCLDLPTSVVPPPPLYKAGNRRFNFLLRFCGRFYMLSLLKLTATENKAVEIT
jgi:hypothetical protein